jgi:protein involved in polysaccharide export with SLBB domain
MPMKWALLMLVWCSLALAQASSSREKRGTMPEIRKGDLLRISVWREPDLTTTLRVQPDGLISFPLLGNVQATGLTPKKLGAVLTERLRQYVRNPQVSVEELYVIEEPLPDWWPIG